MEDTELRAIQVGQSELPRLLEDVVQSFSDTLGETKAKTREILSACNLEALRPVIVCLQGVYDEVVYDCKDSRIQMSISRQLGQLPKSETTEQLDEYAALHDFSWGLPVLIDWCHKRKMPVPKEWQQWKEDYYGLLANRGLITPLQSDTPPAQPGTDRDLASTGGDITGKFFDSGEYYSITFQGESADIRKTKGMRYIRYLLCNQGKEVSVFELYQAINPPDRSSINVSHASMSTKQLEEEGLSLSDLGNAEDVLDATAIESIKEKMDKLREEIDEAEELGDVDRAEELKQEREDVGRYLSPSIRLGGKSRKAPNEIERSRKNVSERIRRDINKITKICPNLGHHLKQAIHTGTVCHYSPRPPVNWSIE